MSSRRLLRVSDSIRGVLARLVSRERTLEGMLLTITGVEVSPDLRHATVFISHLDGRTPDDQILHDLNALKEEWQSEINQALHIKYTPKLHFKFDEAQKRGDRILQIMSELEPGPDQKPANQISQTPQP